jgi:7-keto-8-aminopelargonate synthetase-like enzyme
MFESPQATIRASRALAAAGIYAPPIMQSGVDRNAPRIRFFLNADTDPDLVDRTIDVLRSLR